MNLKASNADENELALIRSAQDGDRNAFGELVLRYRKRVVNLAYRVCGDSDAAQDIAQETFVRAWHHIPGYTPRAAFISWLYRIATNLTLDMLRRRRETLDVDEVRLPTAGRGVEAALETKDRAELVRQAVLDLPPASRSVLVLREYEGQTYREIAETLGIPVGTVMSRLSYARERLLEVLEPCLEEAIL